jgi:peptidyl-tRNA hydrolase, PTH1 family
MTMTWKNFWKTTNEPSNDWAILSLRNPGHKYAHTWHNAGDIALLAAFPECDFREQSSIPGEISETAIEGTNVLIVRSETFMNQSGTPARFLMKKKNITPQHIIVIHDDIDLAIGSARLAIDRGDGGHNGIKDIERQLHTREFWRIKVGIQLPDGKPPVLGKIPEQHEQKLQEAGKRIRHAIELLITQDNNKAQTFLHTE